MTSGALAQQAIIRATGNIRRCAIQGERCHSRNGPVRSELRPRTIGKAQSAAGQLDHQHGYRQQPQTAVAAQAS